MAVNTGNLTLWGCTYLSRALAESVNSVYYVAWGTGTTAHAVTDTTLEVEVERLLATTISRTDQSLSLRVEFTNNDADENDVVPTETGVFTALSGGVMIYRGVVIVAHQRTVVYGETWEPQIDLMGNNGSF